jgi:hypothetical protein
MLQIFCTALIAVSAPYSPDQIDGCRRRISRPHRLQQPVPRRVPPRLRTWRWLPRKARSVPARPENDDIETFSRK